MNRIRKPLIHIKGFLGCFILDELYTPEQATAADIANVRMFRELRAELRFEVFTAGSAASDQVVGTDDALDFQASCACKDVRLIGLAVGE